MKGFGIILVSIALYCLVPSGIINVSAQAAVLKDNGVTEDGKYTFYNKLTKTVALDPTKPYRLDPLKWEDGSIVKEHIYRVGLPSSVRESLVAYAQRIGIYDFIDSIYFSEAANVTSKHLDIATDEYVTLKNGEYWHNKRPTSEWASDMHWISPGDKESHDGYLQALVDGGFDDVLNSIGNTLGLDGISCYHLTFIAVRNCDKGYIHHDFKDTGAKAYNMIIPLNLVPDAEPELDVIDSNNNSGRLKYEYDTALLIGDNALHATASTSNGDYIRLMATVFLVDVNESNVHRMEYSQPYPPNDPEERLRTAGEHWKPDGSTSIRRYLEGFEDMNFDSNLSENILTKSAESEHLKSCSTNDSSSKKNINDTKKSVGLTDALHEAFAHAQEMLLVRKKLSDVGVKFDSPLVLETQNNGKVELGDKYVRVKLEGASIELSTE